MRKNVLLAGLGIAGIALAVIILAGLAVKDGDPPEITFKEDTIMFKEGDDPEVLLDVVTATDKEDGDVSDSLIVKNLYEVSDKYGIVVFAAKDSSNNVTVVSRGFTYDKGGDSGEEDTETSAQPGTEGNTEQPEDEEPSEETPQEGDDPDANGSETQGSAGQTDPSGGTPQEGEAKPGTNGENGGVDYAELKKTNTSAGIPYLKLSQHEITLEKGSSFVVQKYIEEALEGKNGAGKDAMRHIHVDNSPNMSKPGSYDVTVYIRDTDGNVSNKEVIKVTVE